MAVTPAAHLTVCVNILPKLHIYICECENKMRAFFLESRRCDRFCRSSQRKKGSFRPSLRHLSPSTVNAANIVSVGGPWALGIGSSRAQPSEDTNVRSSDGVVHVELVAERVVLPQLPLF